MGENRNRRNKRKSKNSLSNRMALIGITVVVASLAVVVHIGGASLRERDLEYQAREQALEKSLAKEEARAAELEEYRVYRRLLPMELTNTLNRFAISCFDSQRVQFTSFASTIH